MSVSFTLSVAGTPVPQGSKSVTRTGHMYEANKRTAGWRKLVRQRAEEKVAQLGHAPYQGAVEVVLVFRLPRPRGHYGTGRNAGTIRASAPRWPAVKPDIDKLTRAVFDSLTAAGVWADDSRVVHLQASKQYVSAEGQPGVVVEVFPSLDLP